MKFILKTLKPYWALVLLVTVLMVVQALCDLALPQYTSNIIDVGITNRGVSHLVPERITPEEYDYALLFMNQEEKDAWQSAFSEDVGTNGAQDSGADAAAEAGSGAGSEAQSDEAVILRNNLSEEELTSLDGALQVPVLMNYQMSRMPEAQFREMAAAALAASGAPQAEALLSQMKDMSLEEIARITGMEIQSFREENENGEMETYVDVRSLLAAMPPEATSAMREQYRETVESMIETMGPSLLASRGASYAARCDELAGMDMNRVQMNYLWKVGAKMLLFAFLILVTSVLVSYIASGIGAGIGRTLRHDMFHNVIGFSNTEIDRFSTASLITRSTNDIQQIQMIVIMILRMVLYAPIMGVGGIYKVLQTRAHMEWIIILAVASILLLVFVLMRIAMPKFRAMQRLIDGLNMISREILTGLPVIRAFGREEEEEHRFDAANRELTGTQLFTSRTMVFMMPGMSIIMYGVTLLIVWVAAGRIDNGTLQIGTMTAFITYSIMIVMSFLMLTVISIMLPRAGVAAERVEEVLNTGSSVTDPEETEDITEEEHKGLVRFDDVSFRYPGAEEPVLSGISFEAGPGETTAIIGSTGSGKSTLISLIPRFYDVSGGSITVDGVDIRQMKLKNLRGMIGYVPQKGVLFSGTVASNLRFGRDEADEKDMEQAVEIAQASEFVLTSPDAFEAPIAQGGTNVSGGQKQRLAIARAIVRRPKIMIFDDSFSALDMKTDAALRAALDDNLKESTVLVVAQRISTILHADRIIVLENGRMAGIGTHRELMESCPIYQEIASSQLSAEELEQQVKEV